MAVERKSDWADGGFLRILALVVLAAGFSSPRPAVQAFQTLALLSIGVVGAAFVSVKLM